MVRYQVALKNGNYCIIRQKDKCSELLCITSNKDIALLLIDILGQKEERDVQEGKHNHADYKPWRC